jgi:putative transcriptional regulator
MATVKAHLDRKKPPRLSKETKARLDTLADEQLIANALADPDNPPLTSKELKRLATARAVQRARAATGLSQSAFARRFQINPARLKDWEQGRTTPDSAALAYLKVIEREQKTVERVLAPQP